MNWLQRRNVWVAMGCTPPFAWRWMRPSEPKFRRRGLEPYEGYKDRLSGFYVMKFNKHDRAAFQPGESHL